MTHLVHCAACAICAPIEQMRHRDHFGGFYLCLDKVACDIRWHRALCHLIKAGFNRRCMFCTAGTSHMRFTDNALMPRYDGRRRSRT